MSEFGSACWKSLNRSVYHLVQNCTWCRCQQDVRLLNTSASKVQHLGKNMVARIYLHKVAHNMPTVDYSETNTWQIERAFIKLCIEPQNGWVWGRLRQSDRDCILLTLAAYGSYCGSRFIQMYLEYRAAICVLVRTSRKALWNAGFLLEAMIEIYCVLDSALFVGILATWNIRSASL